MTKTSPWWLLFALAVSAVAATVSGAPQDLRVGYVTAFPAFVGALVLLDNVVLVRAKGSLKQKASIRAATLLVLSIVLVWAMRPSPTVAGIIVFCALGESWTLCQRHIRR